MLTVGAIALIPLGLIGFEFIPSVDRGQIFVSVVFPTGTPLATTDAAVRSLTTRFMEISDVQQIVSTSGTTQQGFGGSTNLGSNGQLRVFLNANRKHSTNDVAKMMTGLGHSLVPAAKVVAIPATGTRGGNSQPLDFTVTNSRGEPDAAAQQILGVLQDTPGAINVTSSSLQLSPPIEPPSSSIATGPGRSTSTSAWPHRRSAPPSAERSPPNSTPRTARSTSSALSVSADTKLSTLRSIALATARGRSCPSGSSPF